MNFASRLQGVFFSPQPTFKAISEKPVWVDALVVILILAAIFSYLIAPYADQDALKLLKDNVKFKERMKDRYDSYIKNLENPSLASILLRNVLLSLVGLVIGLLIAGLVLLIMGRLTSTEGNFVLVFSALIHANFIDKILGGAVRLLLAFVRKSVIQTSTSLALVVPKAELTSTAFILLSQIDFFQLWMFGILGYGLSSVFKISVKKGMILSYSFWLLKSLLAVALGFLGRSMLG
jgi:hypothetical protein